MKPLRLIVFLFLTIGIFAACENEVNYSANPNDKLYFSADTVRFDTVFTTVGSSTRLLKVYNRNKQDLLIENIRLEDHANSGFRINVDGMRGTEFSNVEILAGDSIFVFVEVTVNPTSANNPMLIEDHIRFRRAGNEQSVLLEAYGQDAYIWSKKIIDKDTTLTGEKPFLLKDSIIVEPGATLTIAQNTKFFFSKNAGLFVRGTVNAEGTTEQPVVMRGDRTDKMLADIPYDLVSGQWQGVFVDSLSYGNSFENVQIRNAYYGILFHSSETTQKKAVLKNVIIHNNIADGLSATNCDIEVSNAQITNSGGAAVRLVGGKYEFLHTTVANHYQWETRRAAAVVIANKRGEDLFALQNCRFVNSIVDGTQTDEITLEKSEDDTPFNYLFVNCQIKSPEKSGDNFVNVLWSPKEKTFRALNEENSRIYDFRLDSVSVAINAADRQYSLSLPLDLKGVSRLSDENPDLGCYEFVKE